MNTTASPRIFYGWWMVTVCCITMAVGPILITGTFSIFVKPLAETFGWSRGDVASSFLYTAVVLALISPGLGTLLTRPSLS